LAYTEAFLRGIGCIPFNHKMEDAATAEISRVQVWQWVKTGAKTNDGTAITAQLIEQIIASETENLAKTLPAQNKLKETRAIIGHLLLSDTLADFLTTVAYPSIVQTANSSRL
jgi:malate synthase